MVSSPGCRIPRDYIAGLPCPSHHLQTTFHPCWRHHEDCPGATRVEQPLHFLHFQQPHCLFVLFGAVAIHHSGDQRQPKCAKRMERDQGRTVLLESDHCSLFDITFLDHVAFTAAIRSCK